MSLHLCEPCEHGDYEFGRGCLGGRVLTDFEALRILLEAHNDTIEQALHDMPFPLDHPDIGALVTGWLTAAVAADEGEDR